MSPASARIAVPRSETRAPTDFSNHAAHSVRVSSRGLGWAALDFERRDYQPSSRPLAHGSSEHLVFVSLATGRIVRSSGGERVEHELSPGCVAVVPAHTPVSWSWPTRISFSVLRLQPSFVDQVAHSVFGLGPHDYRLTLAERPHDTAITNIAGVLAREAMRGQPGSRLYAESLASMLAVHLLRHYAQCADGRVLGSCATLPEIVAAAPFEAGSRSGAQPRAVSDALAFMHENYARELSLTDIAGAVHLSSFHLARLFKQSLGVAPHQYLIQLRVNSARWLLSAGSGERSLAEVASAVGFADQSHLTRHFKRATGLTPGQFRP
jgi:AraC family transcriptional regulator